MVKIYTFSGKSNIKHTKISTMQQNFGENNWNIPLVYHFIRDQNTLLTGFTEDENALSFFNETCGEVLPGFNHSSQAVVFTASQVFLHKPVIIRYIIWAVNISSLLQLWTHKTQWKKQGMCTFNNINSVTFLSSIFWAWEVTHSKIKSSCSKSAVVRDGGRGVARVVTSENWLTPFLNVLTLPQVVSQQLHQM